ATTREFLERFGLSDLSDLPKVEELSDALGFELPTALSEPTATTSPLPFEGEASTESESPPTARTEPEEEKVH
ncbi:MAG: SMC-Scp complex subunit ScpB, partial [Vicinamibacterales bacterium]